MGLYERVKEVAKSKGYSINRLELELGFARSDLVNEVVTLGYDRDEALEEIDASLDSLLEERKPLAEEEISEELYSDILLGFECEEA